MRTCYACGKNAVERVAAPGRERRYGNGQVVTWPADLAVATCQECGHETLDRSACQAIDKAAENAAACARVRLARPIWWGPGAR